jgi:arylsulfatase A-like enzyme
MERGTTFRNAFVHSPICCPSRMSIMSGRYMQNLNNGNLVNNSYEGGCHGEFWRNNGEQETFAVYAKEAGYNTSYSGKYLSALNGGKALRGTPGCPQCLRAMPGYDKWSEQRHNAIYYNYSLIESNNGINATQTWHGDSYYEDYFPDLVTNRTLAMIEEFTSQEGTRRPFLAVNAWPTAHGPFTPGMYKISFRVFCPSFASYINILIPVIQLRGRSIITMEPRHQELPITMQAMSTTNKSTG